MEATVVSKALARVKANNGAADRRRSPFVLPKQLASFQRNDLEVVDRAMNVGFGYFHFQGAMSSF
jgi:hypothetical protein